MFNTSFTELTFYAFALGALEFIIAELLIKNKRYSALISFVIGLIVTLFVFNTTEPTGTVNGIIEPIIVFVTKASWLLSWLIGIGMGYKILNEGLK
jgi:hypothetical protein